MDKKRDTKSIEHSKEKNFSEWYQDVILKGEMADYTAVSGSIVFKPASYALWENVQSEVDSRLKKMGIKNVYFPLLIPEKYLSKEAEHVEGFSPEVAWVTHAGKSKLNERLAIRPTSETIMYPTYAKWIRSWKDLPLRLNQWNNVIRWEFKNPVPFLRTREFLWNEGHTVFASREEAEKEMVEIIELWKDFTSDYLALPSIVGRKSEKEKFAGAEYSWSCEYILPNGKAAQGPDAHFDGQKFSKAFGISFLDKEEKKQYPYQNTWAISTRMLGIMFAIHGDDKGLVIPPKIARDKAVIIPIFNKSNRVDVIKFARSVEKKIKNHGIVFDDRIDYTPGWKFHEWELKGIPIRIEIGPKDVSGKKVVIVRRDTGKKEDVKLGDVGKRFSEIMGDIQKSLYKKAENELKSKIVDVKNIKELKKVVSDGKIGRAYWCGDRESEERIKAATSAKSLNSDFDAKISKNVRCFESGGDAKYLTYFGRSY